MFHPISMHSPDARTPSREHIRIIFPSGKCERNCTINDYIGLCHSCVKFVCMCDVWVCVHACFDESDWYVSVVGFAPAQIVVLTSGLFWFFQPFRFHVCMWSRLCVNVRTMWADLCITNESELSVLKNSTRTSQTVSASLHLQLRLSALFCIDSNAQMQASLVLNICEVHSRCFYSRFIPCICACVLCVCVRV